MSTDYQQSLLWRRTLGDSNDQWDDKRQELRSAYVHFRSVVQSLAGEIAQSMPMFTDHSIEHVDSLWDTASLLMGPDFPINPAEAFVLGGAFLLHDLGMGLAAFPDGRSSIENDPLYGDFLEISKSRLSSKSGEISEAERKLAAENEATSTILRLRHAKQAERLISQDFYTADKQAFKLLENTALRSIFGPTIGKIAHSHWFDVDDLPAHFSQVLGSYAEHPGDWEIDPLKIACILRLADATHIDSRRAPTYLHAFRRPTGESFEHWYFQQKLTRPRVNGDRLEYTSAHRFSADEAPAWWLAFETISLIDRELRKVDALCADLARPRFKAIAVAGAESADRLSAFIPTEGWRPIDARLRVSQVSQLISRLGGKELYGNRPDVALRELVANAADAVRARSVQYGGSDFGVHVRLTFENDSYWVVVEDKGIGMSADVMVRSLTDFGLSGWQSTDMSMEYPGLVAKGYKSTGKFGIGFFSIFMVSDYVEVKSLKYLDNPSETHILVFPNGLTTRPLLRDATEDEVLHGGGTVVRAKLKFDPLSEEGLFRTEVSNGSRTEMLALLLTELCALADVDLYVSGPGNDDPLQLIVANDWKSLPPRDLFRRLYPKATQAPYERQMYEAYEDVFAEHVRELRDKNGDIIGRAILAAGLESSAIKDLWWWPSPLARVYVGGFRAAYIYDCLGAFAGAPLKADRFAAFPLASVDELKQWAESQAELVRRSKYATARTRYGAGDLARSVGADVPLLPCGFINTGEITAAELKSFIGTREQLHMIPSGEIHIFHREDGSAIFVDQTRGRQILLPDDAIVFDSYSHWFFPDEILKRPRDERFSDYGQIEHGEFNPRNWWYYAGKIGSTALILDAAIASWKCDDAVTLADNFEELELTDKGDARLVVQTADGSESVYISGYRLKRPREI